MFDMDIDPDTTADDFYRITSAELAAWEAESDTDRHLIPDGLDDWLPGPYLAAVLSSVDVNRLSEYDRVVLLKARSRQIAHQQAELFADLDSVADAVSGMSPGFAPEEIFDGAVAEVRAALSWTRRAAEYQLGMAVDLIDRLPQVWSALHAGLIDLPKVRVLVNEVAHLEPDTARSVAETALERAPALTTGQLGALTRRLCIAVAPDKAEDRYREGVAERRIADEANTDGTADLYGRQMPPDRVAAARKRVNQMARSLKTGGETRTMDQLRADVFLDLLCGHSAGNGHTDRGIVDLRVDLTTLAGLTETPCELAGYGPVIADIARKVTEAQAKSEWRWTVADPETGAPLATGITGRRPRAAQRRTIEARAPTCIFPGCRMPSIHCDIDHNQPWAEGGPTADPNLGPFCRHDHVTRHKHNWKVKQLRPGVYQFTSRLGHTYITTDGLPP